MKQLLQDCLSALKERMWDRIPSESGSERYECGCTPPVHADTCKWAKLEKRLESQIALIDKAEAGDREAQIICLADELEDMGNLNAIVVRRVMAGENITGIVEALQVVRELLEIPEIVKQYTSEEEEPMMIEECLERLHDFGNLEQGWNGYNAAPPSTFAIENAERFVRAAYKAKLPPRVTPSAIGGIGLTWRVGERKVYLECYNDEESEPDVIFSDGESEPRIEPALCAELLMHDIMDHLRLGD